MWRVLLQRRRRRASTPLPQNFAGEEAHSVEGLLRDEADHDGERRCGENECDEAIFGENEGEEAILPIAENDELKELLEEHGEDSEADTGAEDPLPRLAHPPPLAIKESPRPPQPRGGRGLEQGGWGRGKGGGGIAAGSLAS